MKEEKPLLEKAEEYLKSIDFKLPMNFKYYYDNCPEFMTNSLIVCCYAHEHNHQKRVNGVPYYEHPVGLAETVEYMFGMYDLWEENEKFFNYIKLKELGLPEDGCGLIEVCLLHDVLEDTEITLEEISTIFSEDYFNDYVKEPLLNITHQKGESYDDYMNRVISHPVSAFVKLLDLRDNLSIFTLKSFDTKIKERCQRYIEYIYRINEKYHLIEKL